jgi:hypothetical protein
MPAAGRDQLPLAQLGQGPAHCDAGNRVLAGKLILGRQGRAERTGAISYMSLATCRQTGSSAAHRRDMLETVDHCQDDDSARASVDDRITLSDWR